MIPHLNPTRIPDGPTAKMVRDAYGAASHLFGLYIDLLNHGRDEEAAAIKVCMEIVGPMSQSLGHEMAQAARVPSGGVRPVEVLS